MWVGELQKGPFPTAYSIEPYSKIEPSYCLSESYLLIYCKFLIFHHFKEIPLQDFQFLKVSNNQWGSSSSKKSKWNFQFQNPLLAEFTTTISTWKLTLPKCNCFLFQCRIFFEHIKSEKSNSPGHCFPCLLSHTASVVSFLYILSTTPLL